MEKIGLHHLGKLVRERRSEHGIREIASKIGVSPATLSRVERGKLPDLATFSKICRWLNVDPAEILHVKLKGSRKPPPQKHKVDAVISAHFRADSTLDSKATRDLAALILAAQKELTRTLK